MARREAILDRDKACLERDQTFKKYNELKAENDTAIENKISQVKVKYISVWDKTKQELKV